MTVTNEANATTLRGATISADGSTIAFVSTTNYVDGQGVESASGVGVQRLYVMDLATGMIRANDAQLDFQGGTLIISADGTNVAMASSRMGPLGPETFFGQREIVATRVGPGGMESFRRLTNSTPTFPDGLAPLQISNDGDVVLSSRRNLTGANPNPFPQFFRVSADANVTQLSNFQSELIQAAPISVDARSSQITILSASNLLGENPLLRNQIFTFDLLTGELRQQTNFTSNVIPAGLSSLSQDGRFASYRTGSVSV